MDVSLDKVVIYASGLPIDLTDCMTLPSEGGVRFEVCKQRIRKALTAYCEDERWEVRRACHRVWPTPSAPISNIVFNDALRAIEQWEKLRKANQQL